MSGSPERYLVSACAAMFALVVPLAAHSAVMCEADDENIKFEFSAGSSISLIGKWWDEKGMLTIKRPDIAIKDTKFSLDKESLQQYWEVGKINAAFFLKSGDAEIQFWFETNLVQGEDEFRGKYNISIDMFDGNEPRKLSGKTTCGVDA